MHPDQIDKTPKLSARCRSCFWRGDIDLQPTDNHRAADHPCPNCDDRRMVFHPEKDQLSIAHVDCDAFYASVEKRDNPSLKGKPVIIGGGQRGVVATCCYLARIRGVRSAMPMFKAKKLCPEATIIKPDMAKYKVVSRDIRALFDELTPLVEPLSLDEAFLDLSGTSALAGLSPADQLIRLANRIEDEIGVSVSVGLSHNKFLAKLASDLDKPRGFSIIGKAETTDLLAELPISKLPGFGKRTIADLAKDGLTMISQIQKLDQKWLITRYGERGQALYQLSRGEDHRTIKPEREAKSVSAETTLNRDLHNLADLERVLLKQCERVAADLKRKNLKGLTVTLKLKTNRHKILTRSSTITAPTQLAHQIFDIAQRLLKPMADGSLYRLVGVGMSQLTIASDDMAEASLFADQEDRKRTKSELAMDSLKEKFGADAVMRGRLFSADTANQKK